MKKITLLSLLVVLFATSCSVNSKVLYNMGGTAGPRATMYDFRVYEYYKKESPQALCNLIVLYDHLVRHPGGIRNVPPPGICAEYGYLLLQPDVVNTFMEKAASKQKAELQADAEVLSPEMLRARGEEMLKREMELYPESRPFIESIIVKIVR